MQVLVAEDDIAMSEYLKLVLRDWGYEPVSAKDGHEAWAILKAPDAPRLALLDWMMPGMDGVDICREVRKLERPQYTYMILITVKDSQWDVIAGMEAGADDYMTKPIHSYELKLRLEAARRVLGLVDKGMASAGEAGAA